MYRTDLDVCCSSHKAISNRTELLLSTKGILRRAERRIELYQIGRILLCNVNGRCMRDIHIIIRDICLNFFVFFCWFFLTLASHKSLEALARSRYPCPKRLEAKTHQLATYQAPMLPWWQGSRRGWQSQSGRCHFFGVPSFVIIFFENFYFILIFNHCQSLQFVLKELCCQSFATYFRSHAAAFGPRESMNRMSNMYINWYPERPPATW